jgi:hypothetical protein
MQTNNPKFLELLIQKCEDLEKEITILKNIIQKLKDQKED